MDECFARRLSRRTIREEEWTSRYFRKLATLYRKSPCLWKKDTRSYLNKEHRHRAYARIHRIMDLPGVTLVEIVLKIRQMRRLYVNELKSLLAAESCGRSYEISLPWFYDLHRFLYPYLDYDEAVELHNVDHGVVEPEEAEKSRSSRSSCNCVRCLISNRDSRVVDFSSTRRPRAIPNSTSSPAVSLPEVKTRPRTCPRSCSRISEARKQLDRYPARARSSSCCENVKSHEDTIEAKLTETRQEKCHEFAISGLHSTASSDDTCETESDHLEAFSVSRTRCLKKLSRPYAMKARAEIERILRSTSIKSKKKAP
ncbi:PREDICTED: uncharacterized protein LOC108555582 isoform X2 [Eufriesea mexicana]|uniref:uncharacterized protein LOC108555582 isoform X2 n=1 Tax=Eufriesea mexicana TaxID=516756 RepID=UPI00083BF82A|nr:PREDICTED: uncharacterized protein LOC108555582 isoform X2 [Eufriesea mexicana]